MQLDKGGKEKVRLGDVAQVVPQGRVVRVMVGEVDVSLHIPPGMVVLARGCLLVYLFKGL